MWGGYVEVPGSFIANVDQYSVALETVGRDGK